MISLHRCADLSAIAPLKTRYLQRLIAPIDGMWAHIIDASPHWEIRVDGARAGYYAADDKGTLLQFYVEPTYAGQERMLFAHVVAHGPLTEAVASTIDPSFLSLCLDVQTKTTVHTLLYAHDGAVDRRRPEADGLAFRLVAAAELAQTVAFQQACLGGAQDLRDWLRGYSSTLIERNELFVLCRGEEWLGLGECRVSDSQEGICDLGMMVHPAHRGNGWATYILSCLLAHSTARGLRAICSTTADNQAAQKAIRRAHFIGTHRIVTVQL